MKPFTRRTFAKASALAALAVTIPEARAERAAGLPDMTVREIWLRHTVMPCRVHLSEGSYSHYDSLFLGLRAGGVWGWGELVTSAKADSLLEPISTLLGKDAAKLDSLLDPGGPNGFNELASQALHDLVSRTLGVPLHLLLGGARRTRIPVMPCMFPENPKDAAKLAASFVQQGYRSIKFKVYGTIEEDLANLRAIRAAIPAEVVLQADANCGYKDPKMFTDTYLAEYARAGLDIFEDPIAGALAENAALRGRTKVKIMADIAARSNEGIRDIITSGAADLVNQHPNHQGGYTRSMLRANACELMGTPVWMGGTGYAGVGVGHWLQMAATRGLSLPSGEVGGWIDHHFAERLLTDHPQPEAGFVNLPQLPGCGVSLDDAQMKRFTDYEQRIQ